MARRAKRDETGMNLFPFMAVLICTVGALIMLLVVMVQQARVKAQAPNEEILARQAEIEQIRHQQQLALVSHEQQKQAAAKQQEKVDELNWRADILQGSYDENVAQLSEERLKLSHLEANTRELEAKATAMQQEADLISASAAEKLEVVDGSQERIASLRNAVEEAKAQLVEEADKLRNLDPKFVLIPYSGQNGTTRRPIYIECLADRVVLQPENVTLVGEDFVEPLAVENPLAQALRAKREFLQDNQLMEQDDEPYPLLVVRPGAATTYAAARAAMKEWESEFGYELVEADLELDYQQADERLTELLEDVVIDSRGKRRMMRTAQNSLQPKRRERLRPSASGGFEKVSGDDLPELTDTNSFGNGNSRYGSSGGNADGDRSWANNSSEQKNTFAGNNLAGNGPASTSAWGNSAVQQPGMQAGFEGNGTGSSAHGGGSSEFANSGLNSGQSWEEGSPGRFGSAGTAGANSSGGESGPGGPESTNAGQWNDSSSQNGLSQNGPYELSNTSPPVATRFRSTVGQNNPFRGGTPGSNANGSQAGAGGSSADATGSGGQGTSGGGGSSSGASQAGQARSMQMGASMGASSSLARNRGSNWAVPNSQDNAVGIQRPIYIVCDTETLSLLPERGTTQELEIFRHRGAVPDVVDAFVKSVRGRLDGWGIAGDGVYWKPVLQIQVNPGAEAAYGQLMRLLENSGIEVTRRL